MSQALLKIADGVRTRFAVCESVPNSGYNDNDRNPTVPSLFVAQQKQLVENTTDKYFCKCSENLVPFYGEWDIILVGDDCTKALNLLQQWSSQVSSLLPEEQTPKQSKMKKLIAKLSILQVDGVARLIFRRALWNDYAQIFYWMGQGLSGQPLPTSEE